MIAMLPDKSAQILLWSGILVVTVLVLFVVTLTIKRRLDTPGGPTGDPPPFTLEELRRMRDAGQIDAEQYDKARARIVELTRGAPTPGDLTPPASATSTGQRRDGGPESNDDPPDNPPNDPPPPRDSDS